MAHILPDTRSGNPLRRIDMRIIRTTHLRSIHFLALVFITTLSVGIVGAKTQYVSDELIVPMRAGKGNEYKIIKMLTTGTPLEIIEEDKDYLKVRAQDGQDGWVLKQFIISETPKAKIIAGLKQEIDRLRAESKDVLALMNERDSLKALSGRLSTETEQLRKENSYLKRLEILWWFLAGAGVFFIGWITGRVSRKKKYY
jgi:SH3 domain protein